MTSPRPPTDVGFGRTVFTHRRQKSTLGRAASPLSSEARDGHHAPSASAIGRVRSSDNLNSSTRLGARFRDRQRIQVGNGTNERGAKAGRPADGPSNYRRDMRALRGAVPEAAPSFETPARRLPDEVTRQGRARRGGFQTRRAVDRAPPCLPRRRGRQNPHPWTNGQPPSLRGRKASAAGMVARVL